MNKKKVLIISLILVLLIIFSSSTYAYWKWRSDASNKTNITFTTGYNFSCSADGGGNITQNDATLIPTYCTNSPYVIKRTVTTNVVNNSGRNIYMDLWLKVNNIGQELSNSQYFSYALTDSPDGCTSGTVLSSGTFNGKNNTTNNKVGILHNDIYATSSNKTYYLYIWLDVEETNNDTQNQQFNLELEGSCGQEPTTSAGSSRKYGTFRDNTLNGSDPDYIENLIPVTLNASGSVVTVANTDQEWYSYSDKEWANAVLVKESNGTQTRAYYLSHPGATITESDILAYYVWIPRYSYQVWAYSGSDAAGNPREIPIRFVGTGTKETATQSGEWYTHPAFTFGNTEVSGIWVGKFETSHETLSSSKIYNNLGCSSTSCTTYNGLRILPNVSSLRRNNVSNFFFASRAMETNGNDFGINSNTTDSHMMKNSEWGAVAYLSHSEYGINTKIRINNNSNYTTGCGALNANDSDTSTCNNAYKTVNTYPQSTTGNVTGVFDMSGGAHEYVMGTYDALNRFGNYEAIYENRFMGDYSGFEPISYYTYEETCTQVLIPGYEEEVCDWVQGEGYWEWDDELGEDVWREGESYEDCHTEWHVDEYVEECTPVSSEYVEGTNPLPDSKYYDNYANPPFDGDSSTNFTKCTLATCGGHSLNETKNWYSYDAYFVYSGLPWFMRGGYYYSGSYSGSSAGAFRSGIDDGNAYTNFSARLVLLAE